MHLSTLYINKRHAICNKLFRVKLIVKCRAQQARTMIAGHLSVTRGRRRISARQKAVAVFGKRSIQRFAFVYFTRCASIWWPFLSSALAIISRLRESSLHAISVSQNRM